MKKRGFTLIELLVVIAIIGILAGIVLVSVGGARDKAKDARIKADLAQVRSQAEVYYDDNNYTYGGFCDDSSIAVLETDISTMGGTLICTETNDGSGYCVSSVLNDGTTYCTSSDGTTGTQTCADGLCPQL